MTSIKLIKANKTGVNLNRIGGTVKI